LFKFSPSVYNKSWLDIYYRSEKFLSGDIILKNKAIWKNVTCIKLASEKIGTVHFLFLL